MAATNPYLDVLNTKLGIKGPLPNTSTAANFAPPKTVSTGIAVPAPKQADNPYMQVVNNLNASASYAKSQGAIDQGNASIQEEMNPGFFKSVWDTAKNVPGAAAQIGKEAVTHPLQSASSALIGIADIIPSIANLFEAGAEKLGAPHYRIPSVGQLIDQTAAKMQASGHTDVPLPRAGNDEQTAIEGGAQQYAGFELGNELTGATGLGGASKRIVGNVVGGQLLADPEMSAKQRGEQALFDGTFGAVQEGLGVGFKKMTGGKVATPEVGTDMPSEVAEFAPHMADAKEVVPTNPFATSDAALKQNEVKYTPRGSMGVDENGEKILAKTHFDHATGNAVIEYDKSLDAAKNAELKAAVLDHEHGHVVDNRINGGTNLSSELPNPTGNIENLTKVLQNTADDLKLSVEETATRLNSEIKKLAGDQSNQAEAFAEAYRNFKADPEAGAKEAPTFAALLRQPAGERFDVSTTTARDALGNAPQEVKGKYIKDTTIKVNNNEYNLTGKAHGDYQAARAEHDTKMAALDELAKTRPEEAEIIRQGMGNEFSRKVREIVGAYNPKELSKILIKEEGNYPGKNVTVDINGKSVEGNIFGRPKDGSFTVKLKDGTVLKNVSEDTIKDPRSKEQILKDATDRSGVLKKAPPEPKPLKEHSPAYKELLSRWGIKDTTADTKPVKIVDRDGGVKEIKRTSNGESTVIVPETAAEVKAGTRAAAVTGKGTSLEGGTGLDTGERISKKQGINLEKVNASQETKDLLKKIDDENGNFSEQRMRKSFDKIDELSHLVGLSKEDLMAAKPGSIVNTETLAKARQLVVDQAQELADYLKTFNTADATKEQLSTMREKYETLVAMQKATAGYTSEAGTLLNSLKREVAPGENATLQQLANTLKGYGIEDAEQLANKVGKNATLTPIQRATEKYFGLWYQAILSGPKTIARNIVGNFGNIVTQLVSKTANPALWKELPSAMSGFIQGFKEATPEFFKDFNEAIKGKQVTDTEGSKLFDAVDPTRPNVWNTKNKIGQLGQTFENVGKVLLSDKYTGKVAERMEQAALKVYAPEISDNLNSALTEYYREKAVYHGMPTGRALAGITQGAETLRRVFPPARVIIPFVRTVANIIDAQLDYVPVIAHMRAYVPGFIDRQVEEMQHLTGYKLSADEETLVRQRLTDHAVGKAFFGTAISGAAVALAVNGAISGNGPSNANEKQQLMRTGWRPNSVKIGDTWIPYTNLGPLAGLFAMAGNIHDSVTYDGKSDSSIPGLIGLGLLGWMQSELNSSFLQGTAKLIDAIENKTTSFFPQLITGLLPIPAAYTQTKDIIARQQYQTSSIQDEIRDKLGLTGSIFGMKALEPRLDAFGQPMTSDLVYGLSPSRETADAVDQFLIANDTVVATPLKSSSYTVPGTKTKAKLDDENYNKYVKESGTRIYEDLQKDIPLMKNLTPEQRKQYVTNLVDKVRTAVRNKVLIAQYRANKKHD